MNGFEMIQPVLVMATIVVLGYLVTLRVQVTGEVKQFIAFVVINFALPAVVVNSIFQAEFDAEMWRQLILVFLIGLMLNIVGVGTGYISGKLLKYTEEEARQLAVLAGLGNTGFIGIPLTVMIFGSEAGVFAAIYDATTVLTVFTLGIVLLQQGSFRFGQLKSALNAPVIALVGSIVIVSGGGSLPSFLFELSEILSSVAAPLAMLYIGLLIAEWTPEWGKQLKTYYAGLVASAVGIKVFMLPMVAFLLLPIIDLPADVQQIVVIQACMPTFIMAAVLFEKYSGNGKLGMMTIILAAAASLIVIPLIIFLSFLL